MATNVVKNEADKVYVVDDDADVGHSIGVTLSSVGYAVERFASAAEFLDHASAAGPCVAIVDMMLPGMTGLNLCREINLRRMPCSFLVISGHADVPSSVEAMRMGAIDLLEKPFSRQRMLEIVNKAVRVAQLNYERRLEEEEATRQLSALSPRERVVFDALASGLITKEISKRLDISPRTVDVHRSRILQKLRIDSPSRLAKFLAIHERKAFLSLSATA